jgi:hypothetical protein
MRLVTDCLSNNQQPNGRGFGSAHNLTQPMSEKIYCGRGKRFGNYGTISINICVDDIPKEFITKSNTNGKRYVKLNVDERREADPYGNTHTVSVDTWRPNTASAPAPPLAPPKPPQQSAVKQAEVWDKDEDEIPF